MSAGYSSDGLGIDRTSDLEGVAPAYVAQPTRRANIGIEDLDLEKAGAGVEYSEHFIKSFGGKSIPIFHRPVGPSRRVFNDLESIFSENVERGAEDSEPRLCEISSRWVEKRTATGDSDYYLNLVEREGQQDKLGSDDVEWIHQKEDVKTHAKFSRLFSHHALKDTAEGIDRNTAGLLKRVQDEEEKPYVAGFYLNPCAARYDGIESFDAEHRPCTFINFPYFALQDAQHTDRYTEKVPAGDRPYPTRSLLQTRYRLETTEKRDKLQSVTYLSNSEVNTSIQPEEAYTGGLKNAKCSKILHVPQLWGLLISREKFITSAPISIKDLYESISSVKDIKPTAQMSEVAPTMVRIILETKLNEKPYEKKYFYNINRCDWYFGLQEKQRQIQNITEGNQNRIFQLYIRDSNKTEQIVTEENWVPCIQSCNSSIVEVRMRELTPKTPNERKSLGINTTVQNAETECGSGQPPTTNEDSGGIQTELHMSLVRKSIDIAPRSLIRIKRPAVNSTPIDIRSYKPIDQITRVPFFEWPFRKQPRSGRESKGSERARKILTLRLAHDLRIAYTNDFKNTHTCTELDLKTLEVIEAIQPEALEEYNEGMRKRIFEIRGRAVPGAQDVRERQILELVDVNERLIGAFISYKLAFGDGFQLDSNSTDQNRSQTRQPTHIPVANGTLVVPIRKRESGSNADAATKMIRLYRGILSSISSCIRSSAMDSGDFRSLIEGFEKILVLVTRLHLGVFSFRDSRLPAVGDDYIGAGILQEAMLDAFKEAIYLLLALRNYLGQKLDARENDETFPINRFTEKYFEGCYNALDTARKHLIAEAADIGAPETATAETIFILLLERLSKGVHSEGTIDVIDIYEKVLEKLVFEVENNASRPLLITINKTSEELDIVEDVLRQQEKVLSVFCALLDPDTFKPVDSQNLKLKQGPSKAPEGRSKSFKDESKLISNILKATRERIADCEELRNRVARLATQNTQLVESDKDANERAILMFTIVTIIFLPLSFLTGFFGMNLKGFAGTSYDARHFWEIAVPLTAGIATPCLLLAFWSRLVRAKIKVKKLCQNFLQ